MTAENEARLIAIEAGPEYWLPGDVDHIIKNASDDPDRGEIASDLWSLGAGLEHEGCRYRGEDPHDADYENACEACEQHLLTVADRIIAALTPGEVL